MKEDQSIWEGVLVKFRVRVYMEDKKGEEGR